MPISRDQLLLYAVTDRGYTGKQSLYEQIRAALDGGVTCVQLREKGMEKSALIEEAIRIRELCRRYHVPLLINDHTDVALQSGADGVHVGLQDQPISEIRRMAGSNFIIGATAKTAEQAQKAEAAGADYLGVGAVFPSPTKKNAVRITYGQLKEICSSVSIPAVAIGGISLANMSEIAGCGISGIAVASGIFSADRIKDTAEQFRQKAARIVSLP